MSESVFPERIPFEDALFGSLLGTALGDALGLPYEKLYSLKGRRRIGEPDRMRLIWGKGLISDDTEHALFTAAALAESAGESGLFGKRLARQFRYWMLGLPPGIGLATLRAGARSCAGMGVEQSGVWSAGNGPAMRAPILGVAAPDLATLREWNRISTRMTHTDPKAEAGALAVALAAMAERDELPNQEFLRLLEYEMAAFPLPDVGPFLVTRAKQSLESAKKGEQVGEFAASMGMKHGISGYIMSTVPGVLHAWIRYRGTGAEGFRLGLMDIIQAGGDTDTTAAILGGILGARLRDEQFPADWVRALAEKPRTVEFLRRTAASAALALESGTAQRAPSVPLPVVWGRNVVFTAIVLGHGFRRLVP